MRRRDSGQARGRGRTVLTAEMERDMNRILGLLGLLVAGAFACGKPNGQATAARPFDATAEINAWLEAWNTRDLSLVDDLFVNDSSATYFSSEKEGLIRGFAAIREHHAGFGFVPGGDAPEDELWVADLHASMFGSAAVVTAIWYFGSRSGNPDSVQRGPMTAVYVADGGGYRIAHMHFSSYPLAN